MEHNLLEEYIEGGKLKEIELLLEQNPVLASQKTSQNISPIMLSAYYKRHEIAHIISSYAPSITVFEAIALGKLDLLSDAINRNEELIHEFSEDGFSLLYLASFFENEEIIRFLILNGANPNIPSNNSYRIYPLHTAVANSSTMIAKMLIEGGAECNVSQYSGITPLHLAAKNGDIELLITLLEAGADVNSKNNEGYKPSDLAFENGFIEISKILT